MGGSEAHPLPTGRLGYSRKRLRDKLISVTKETKQAIFIRHGQSMANVGLWDGEFSQVPLTAVGFEQAEAVAKQWDFTPDRIIVSPYLRTQQTAAPTIARFPEVPVETWDIHEFTLWDRAHWGATTPEEDVEEVERIWRIADPAYRHGADAGPGAESFGDLLQRTEVTLRRLAAMEGNERVLLFTHGHFMQALKHTLLFPEWSAKQKMENFRSYDDLYRVKNTELLLVELENGKWRPR